MKKSGVLAFATAAFALVLQSSSSIASPIDVGSWYQVARMSDSDNGMFDGNGDLKSDYTYGTFTSVLQSDDFARPFDVYAGMEILFITGDLLYWAQGSYADLRSLIDAHAGSFLPNISFSSAINGVEQATTGNVLSRNGNPEDPWISISGDHGAAVAASLIIWGEDGFGDDLSFAIGHANLKNAHKGVNVYVSQLPSEVPLPAALPLFAAGLGAMGYLGWRKRRAQGPASG